MSEITESAAFALLDSVLADATISPNASRDDIEAVEHEFGVRLPDSYKRFLKRYGSLMLGQITVFGLGLPVTAPPSLVFALRTLRTLQPDIPKNLIPIEPLTPGEFACLQYDAIAGTHPVVRLVLTDATSQPWQLATLDGDFPSYLHRRLKYHRYRVIGIRTMRSHVGQFEEDYLKAGRVPRNHVWRPFRYCTQDVVLGLTVVRHSIDNNCLEVDACMTSDVPEFEPNSGAQVMASFLLSEGYKCGGSMEVRFTENVEGGSVPRALCDLADTYGVHLQHVVEGRITPSEARRLYVAITEFSPALQDHIEALAKAGVLSQSPFGNSCVVE
jgi:hypothetical protein